MTPNENGILEPSKQNTEAPESTLHQPESTSAAHNVGQYEHITKINGYCQHQVLGGCELDSAPEQPASVESEQ